METPLKVVGFETIVTERTGKQKIRVYCESQLVPEWPDLPSSGMMVTRLFFDPEYVKYEPVVGDVIIAIDGRFGIDRIIKVK